MAQKVEKPHYIKCGPVPELRDWRSLPTSQLTRAERNMRFIEKYLKAPGGSYAGKPIKLAPFQENFFTRRNDPHQIAKIGRTLQHIPSHAKNHTGLLL